MKRLLAGLALLGPLSVPCVAQSAARVDQPGFNLFTVQQDVDLGRQSAVVAERQLRLLGDPSTNAYLNRIVQRLALQAPGAKYPYTIKVVNAAEINAFSLPGGPLYVNRGLIDAARSEAELAGVLAHEMSHVALRHGTHQASKSYMASAGLGILGGLLGGSGSSASQVVNAIGGVGLNAAFMKFSRDDEYQADRTGAQIMARAGYDPMAMATMFEMLQAQQSREPGKLEQFFSDHPPAADRGVRIRQLATSLGTGQPQVLGGFDNLKARLQRFGPAPSQQVAIVDNSGTSSGTNNGVTPAPARVPLPSTRFARYANPSGFFTINYPNNWRPTAGTQSFAATFAPSGGVVSNSSGTQQAVVYGVIINHYAPFQGATDRWNSSLQRNYTPFEDRNNPRGTLEDATDDLIRQIVQTNSYLQAPAGTAQPEQIDGMEAYSVVLTGISPVTGEDERVTVYTRELSDGHVVYLLTIVPTREAAAFDRTFDRMIQSLRINDEAAHRATRTALRYGLP